MTSTLTPKRTFSICILLLIISIGLENHFKSVLAFLPCILITSVIGFIQLRKKGDLLFLTVFTTLMVVMLVILLTQGNVLDISFLKRMTG